MLASMILGVTGLNSLTFGPGSLELRLITAKLAARNGGDAALYAGPDEKAQKRWRSLMYGKEYGDADADAPGCCVWLENDDKKGKATVPRTMCKVFGEVPYRHTSAQKS